MSGLSSVTLFLSGDVMLGRGIDQVLPHSVDPVLYEPTVRDACEYVALAERRHGPIVRPLSYEMLWGDALPALQQHRPDIRIINLETAATTSDTAWPGKGIHYRTHPANLAALSAAGVDVAVLANNHVLDWDRPGLAETIATLRSIGVQPVGAGMDDDAATSPATLKLRDGGRLLVFAAAARDSGVPPDWEAEPETPGVQVLHRLSMWIADAVTKEIGRHKRRGDVVVFSVHWGDNWGYGIPQAHREFARSLIDAGVDVVHGHSSHHVKGIELYRDRVIFYGCGDLITDYEGIGGQERYRPDLGLLHLPSIDATTGELRSLKLVPMRMHRFQLQRAVGDEALWLRDTLNRESTGLHFDLEPNDELVARWRRSP